MGVYGQCTPTYTAQWTLWLARYYNSLICPVNECKTGDYTCHVNANCVDQPKGYDCVCGENYTGDGYTTCDPINWCAIGDTCNAYANCIPGEGGVGYTCECKLGLQKSEVTWTPFFNTILDIRVKNAQPLSIFK